MKRSSAWILSLVAVSLLGLAGTRTARADCESLLTQFNAALRDRDLPKLGQVEELVAGSADCGNRLVEVQRRRAALQLSMAQELIDRKAPVADYEALVLSADKPDVLWQAAFMLG